eukprot:bmy_15042T0
MNPQDDPVNCLLPEALSPRLQEKCRSDHCPSYLNASPHRADLGTVKTCEMCKQSLLVDLDDFNVTEFYQKHQQSRQLKCHFRGVTLAFRSLACLYPDLFLQKAQLSQNGARECGQSCSYLFKILRLLDKKGRKDEREEGRKEGKEGRKGREGERERERREGGKEEKNGDLSSTAKKCDIMDSLEDWASGS